MKNSKFINGRSPTIARVVVCNTCGSLGVSKTANIGIFMHGVAEAWVHCNKCNSYCEWSFRTTIPRKELTEQQELALISLQSSYRLYNDKDLGKTIKESSVGEA